MKAILLAAALGGATFPGTAQTGVVTGSGFDGDQGSACTRAMDNAKAAAVLDGMRYGKSNAHVVSFGQCKCDPPMPTQDRELSPGWHCTVQATYSTD